MHVHIEAVAAGGGGGAPSGCNFFLNSKFSNKNKQILTRNERIN